MKKYLKLTFLLLIISVLFTGCDSTQEQKDKNILLEKNSEEENIQEFDEETKTIEDYFPFMENTKLEYEGIGNEFAEQTTFFEFIENNRAQLKIFNPGTVAVKILEYKDGELREVFTEGEFYHIENMLDIRGESQNVILKEPLKAGNSWNIPGGHKRTISGIDVSIETPYKTFKALEVTTEFGDGKVQLDYYAKGVGLVASIYKDGEFEVKTLLEDIEKEPYETEITFYYPLYSDIKVAYLERDIKFNTNDSIEKIIENNFKNPPSDKLLPVISDNTRVNSIKLNRGNKTVNIDFSEEFISEMNAGSSLEGSILKSVVNTLGNYYGVEKVFISIEGKPYSSGHFAIEENEYFTVDDSDLVEFKD
ncbi:sporulation and spore germination protein [Keratinibaculum paraultunense]|uniref:Sporulation and spore germination protein n=1 Tax=Keratinibaculum paraultunense TaxID=1278232 RepID=A0A4R3L2H8_9FIRM|nr:GerMN domain-containing protein [Keratinibaculum paraultunense]QQY80214.1 GerMN domain-containing protein [Keratinibaculum paraultunense]TCS90725.1 sporulation and spore germination protein [Keratinibaculum paraultunense]